MEQLQEARDWLRTSTHPTALASNRFDSTADALAFVERLYRAGAEQVYVVGQMDETEGSYSDMLVVQLPRDTQVQQHINHVITNDMQEFGGQIVERNKRGPRTLTLWWD